jgi:hypothetical protein
MGKGVAGGTMKLDELIQHTAETLEQCGELLIKKNADYSENADVHSNFKEMAQLCGWLGVDVSKPEGCVQFFVLVKIHRLFKLIREGKTPQNEGLHDSCVDQINYLLLLETLL